MRCVELGTGLVAGRLLFFFVDRHLPKEIVPTVQFRLATEALVGQRLEALAAAHAVRMPGAFEDVEQELVENRLVAAGTGVSHPADRRFASACMADGCEWGYQKVNGQILQQHTHTHMMDKSVGGRPVETTKAFATQKSSDLLRT